MQKPALRATVNIFGNLFDISFIIVLSPALELVLMIVQPYIFT